jgi:hypothetical protein
MQPLGERSRFELPRCAGTVATAHNLNSDPCEATMIACACNEVRFRTQRACVGAKRRLLERGAG